MFAKIFVPVDLAHCEALKKALHVAGKLARDCGASIAYGGVTTSTANAVASTPQEFSDKLAAFAKDQADAFAVETEPLAVTSHDPATDLTATLLEAIEASNADVVVMASHVPGVLDHIFASNAATIASQSSISVFVVR